MKLVIEELAGEEFVELLKYIHSPQNTFEWGERNDSHLKVKIGSIREFLERSNYDNSERRHLATEVYRGIELEISDADKTRLSPQEFSDLMKLIYYRR